MVIDVERQAERVCGIGIRQIVRWQFIKQIVLGLKQSKIPQILKKNLQGQNLELSEYVESLSLANRQLSKENQDLKQKVSLQSKAYQQLNENAKGNLMESNQKWFSFTRELSNVSKELLRMVEQTHYNGIPQSEVQIVRIKKKIQQYEKFLSSTIEELMSQSQDISLFEKASMADQDNSNMAAQNPQISHGEQYVPIQHESIDEPQYAPLDYAKIIKLFTTSHNEILIANVLQALRWRIVNARSTYERRWVVVSYSTHDIIGTHEKNKILAEFLLQKSHPLVQEQTLKLLNFLASDYSGRTYLTQSSTVVRLLVEIIKKEKGDTTKRKNAIGALQKISLRRQSQIWMIQGDLIKQILIILKNEKFTLSEYCLEYITAMLMNLSLRSSGKDKIEQVKELAFEVLLNLLECQNDQIRTFINGTLYTLLSRISMKQFAVQLNLPDILSNLLETCDERFQKQINYMLQQFRQENLIDGSQIETLSDQMEENDIDDIEDEEEFVPDGDDEVTINESDMIVGEELLIKEFALNEQEAEKQRAIMESIILKGLKEKEQEIDESHYEESKVPIIQHRDKQLTEIKNSYLQQFPNAQRSVDDEQKIKEMIKIGEWQQQHPIQPPVEKKDFAFQSRPKIPRTPPVFQQ